MVADPTLAPVTIVTTRGAVNVPCEMKRVDGDTVAVEGSLVVRVMKTPPAGASVPNATGKLTVPPGATVTFDGRRMDEVWKVHCNWEKSTGREFSI